MIAANGIQPNAAPAFAGHYWLRPGVLDAHRRGRYCGMLRPVSRMAILLRNW
ncbi:hypothetical protein BH18ACT10_BH18ACT10_07600 [soil metagenome]|nr:hypothetical protein [Rubrobacter sp.]